MTTGGSLKRGKPWQEWRPLSAHIGSGQPAGTVGGTKFISQLVETYEKDFARLPVSECAWRGSARRFQSFKLREEVENHNVGGGKFEAPYRPHSAAGYLEWRHSRYGKRECKLRGTTREDIRAKVAFYEEVVRKQTLGIRPHGAADGDQAAAPPDEAGSDEARPQPPPPPGLLVVEVPSEPDAEPQEPGNGGAAPSPILSQRQVMGSAESSGRGHFPSPWQAMDEKEPSRRAKDQSRQGAAVDWRGKLIRRRGPPEAPAVPRERYPRPSAHMRVPRAPLEDEVAAAAETIRYIDAFSTDPRLKEHFSMDMERVWRSRTTIDPRHWPPAGSKVSYQRLKGRGIVKDDPPSPRGPLSGSLEAMMYRVLEGPDGLQPDRDKLRKERLELRDALRTLVPLLQRMFDHYRSAGAPGGLPNPEAVGYVEDSAAADGLRRCKAESFPALLEGYRPKVNLTDIAVPPEEVDEVVRLEDFVDLRDYNEARSQAVMDIAARKRKEMRQAMTEEAECLKERFALRRPLEGPLITFAQIWRCMHECRFVCSELPLAAANRLIYPPSELLAHQSEEIAEGRDLRGGFRAALRWVKEMSAQGLRSGSSSRRNLGGRSGKASFASVVTAACGSQGASRSSHATPLCSMMRQGSGNIPGRASPVRIGRTSPSRDKRDEHPAASSPPTGGATAPTIKGLFSHKDPEGTGLPLHNLVASHRGRRVSRFAMRIFGAMRELDADESLIGDGNGSWTGESLGSNESSLVNLFSEEEASRNGSMDNGAARQMLSGLSRSRLGPRPSSENFGDRGLATQSFTAHKGGLTLEALLDSEEPHSPYAAGIAHQQSRVIDFSHFIESIIRIGHARYYNPKWDNSVASCLISAIDVHYARFEEAVQLRDVALKQLNQWVLGAKATEALPVSGGSNVAHHATHNAELLDVPKDTPTWKEIMAEETMEKILRDRQCRLMKVFLYFGTDLAEVPMEAQLPGGPIMSFNEFLQLLDESRVLESRLDPRKVRDIFQDVTGIAEVVASNHKNNKNSEMTFAEFLEALVHCAAVLQPAKDATTLQDHVVDFLDDKLFSHCQTAVPGKF